MADGESAFSEAMKFAEKNWMGGAVIAAGTFAVLHHARKMWGQPDPKTGKPGQLGGIIVSVFFGGERPSPPPAAASGANG